ncbi:unnamed protein product [Rotaria sp. Silwood2]|nr:unnamed protein product [Rotaria sp. Silwood2]
MGSLVSSRNNICSFKIDDRMSTCGSANINDLKEEDDRFNEESVLVGKFCSSWRTKIFEILFGIHFNNPNNTEVTDRVSDEFYSYFQDVAKQTTLIYNEVFATMKTEQTLEDIQGFVNEYLIYFFLDEENYLPSMINLENLFAPCSSTTKNLECARTKSRTNAYNVLAPYFTFKLIDEMSQSQWCYN